MIGSRIILPHIRHPDLLGPGSRGNTGSFLSGFWMWSVVVQLPCDIGGAIGVARDDVFSY